MTPPDERRPGQQAEATSQSTAGEDLNSTSSIAQPADPDRMSRRGVDITTVPLTSTDETRLRELEEVISAGLTTFAAVGNALTEINASRLYRATHATFADYVADRFGVSRSYAYRQINAAKLADTMSPIGDIVNEAQARELDGLGSVEAGEVWRKANEATAGNITARAVREARRGVELDRVARIDPDAILADPVVAADLVRRAIAKHPQAAGAAIQGLEDMRAAAPTPKVRDRGKGERFTLAMVAIRGADRYLQRFADAASGAAWTDEEASAFEGVLDRVVDVVGLIRVALRSASWDDELDKLTGDGGTS